MALLVQFDSDYGWERYRKAGITVLDTKHSPARPVYSPAEVLAAHRQIAAEFGNQADKLVREARIRAQEQTPKRSPESSQQVARQAIIYARDRSFEREAVTDERELYRDALRRGMSETTYSEVRAGFEARIAAVS